MNAPTDEARLEAIAHLRTLFEAQEYVFACWHPHMPARLGSTLRTRLDWEEYFRSCTRLPTMVLPNPLVPIPALGQNGKLTLRGSNSIRSWRHATVEVAGCSCWQLIERWEAGFWRRVSALVATGTGTMQAFVRVDAPDEAGWKWWGTQLVSLGCQSHCTRTTSLARLAGGLRPLGPRTTRDTVVPMVPQELLYLRSLTAEDGK